MTLALEKAQSWWDRYIELPQSFCKIKHGRVF
ncbi:MAG: hypothetical protein RLZZ574_669 [Cyanobacteriota bacterium]